LRLDHAQLLELAAHVGSDVPFFLVGGAALATGRGERLRYLPTLPATWVVLACPDAEVSTAWAYANLDLARVPRRPNTQRLVEALRAEDVAAVARELCNVFEPLVSERYPQVQELKRRLLEAGALGASMTGTGPAVFGLFPGEAEARRAWEALRASADAEVVLTRTFAELER
ncbi:MAG: 4-(cytidine 5'-diphospho)-2-C-methyl-D-erythritol kinase, partial [Armatimonadota bacterium]|nr:4-(cytidine 5'-diphospho)-2-C-methyl-D-erythritol kinase [Armatimonadota bacterium]